MSGWSRAKKVGGAAEELVLEWLRSLDWQVERVPLDEQLQLGAGDLRATIEIEVKADASGRPNCALELTTHGAEPRFSGIQSSSASHLALVRLHGGPSIFARLEAVRRAIPGWLGRGYNIVPMRDEDSRASRSCLLVPWVELEKIGRIIRIGEGR